MNQFIAILLSLCLSSQVLASRTSEIGLRDKIGQMLLIGFDGKRVNDQSQIVKDIQEKNIGGVILFDYNSREKNYDKNIESPVQVQKLNKDLQHYTEQGNIQHNRPNLPLLISVDYEGGKVNRLKESYGFPATISAGDVGEKNIEDADTIAEAMAITLSEAGFNLNFAPVVDVNVNPDNPIIGKKGRSFSKDEHEVARYAGIFTRHFLNQRIQCAYKHFPGHGSSTQDSHLGFVDVTDTWQTYELEPYIQLLKDESCGMIMTAHIVNRNLDDSNLPATLSHKILTDLLRKQLNFKGVIITDDMQMKAISDNYGLSEAMVLAINAGADMLIFGNNLTVEPKSADQLINIIESKIKTGEISEQRVDEAYHRIVALKKSLNRSI